VKNRIIGDQQRTCFALGEARELRINPIFRPGVENLDLLSDRTGRRRDLVQMRLGVWIIRIAEDSDQGRSGDNLAQQLEPLGAQEPE
jgi:hypothetical protein